MRVDAVARQYLLVSGARHVIERHLTQETRGSEARWMRWRAIFACP